MHYQRRGGTDNPLELNLTSNLPENNYTEPKISTNGIKPITDDLLHKNDIDSKRTKQEGMPEEYRKEDTEKTGRKGQKSRIFLSHMVDSDRFVPSSSLTSPNDIFYISPVTRYASVLPRLLTIALAVSRAITLKTSGKTLTEENRTHEVLLQRLLAVLEREETSRSRSTVIEIYAI